MPNSIEKLINNIDKYGRPLDDKNTDSTIEKICNGIALSCLCSFEHPTTTLEKAFHKLELLDKLIADEIDIEEFAKNLSNCDVLPVDLSEDPHLPEQYYNSVCIFFCLAHDERCSLEEAIKIIDERHIWGYFATNGRGIGWDNPQWICDDIREAMHS